MPAFSSITVNDRESTPVAHTFTPDSKDQAGVATYRESDGVPAGDNLITLSRRRLPSGLWKTRMVVTMPVMVTETINGVDRETVERIGKADVTFTYSDSSSLQERQNLVGILANALAASVSQVDDVVTALEAIY